MGVDGKRFRNIDHRMKSSRSLSVLLKHRTASLGSNGDKAVHVLIFKGCSPFFKHSLPIRQSALTNSPTPPPILLEYDVKLHLPTGLVTPLLALHAPKAT
jgi:hypothetical protein